MGVSPVHCNVSPAAWSCTPPTTATATAAASLFHLSETRRNGEIKNRSNEGGVIKLKDEGSIKTDGVEKPLRWARSDALSKQCEIPFQRAERSDLPPVPLRLSLSHLVLPHLPRPTLTKQIQEPNCQMIAVVLLQNQTDETIKVLWYKSL